MVDAWAKWLVGFLAAAFMAWAGIVWNGVGQVMETLRAMEVQMTSQLATMGEKQRQLESHLRDHEGEPAHGSVLLEIQKIQSQVTAVQVQQETMQRQIQEVHRVINNNSIMRDGR